MRPPFARWFTARIAPPLWAKEIRLVRPVFLIALALAVAPVWVLGALSAHATDSLALAQAPLWLGAILLVLASFGREFACGTFPLLLAQPVRRQEVWRVKFTVLAAALAIVLTAGIISLALWAGANYGPGDWWAPRGGLAAVPLYGLVILGGGLAATLAVRQAVTAFWVSLLGLLQVVLLVGWWDQTPILVWPALGLGALLLLAWGRRHFLRAEETGWGILTRELSRPRLPARAAGRVSRAGNRSHRPGAMLWRKELQLQQASLLGMAALFTLHLIMVAARKTRERGDTTMFGTMVEIFGMLWYVVPVCTGGVSLAEERRLGTWAGQLCQPVTVGRQFLIKLAATVLLNGVLSGLLLWSAEAIGAAWGVPARLGDLRWDLAALPGLLLVFAALAGIAFYASTLCRNALQAMVATVGVLLGIAVLWSWVGETGMPWAGGYWAQPLVAWTFGSGLALTLVCLARGNCRQVQDSGRLWFRNLRTLALAILLILVGTSLTYHRVWELVPWPLAMGPARMVPDAKLTLRAGAGNRWEAGLPGGRVWAAGGLNARGNPVAGGAWVTGSNWLATVDLHDHWIGVRTDGTLWITARATAPPAIASPGDLERVGAADDWRQVVPWPRHNGVLLLRADGSLWSYQIWGGGAKAHSPPPPREAPQLLDADRAWRSLLAGGGTVVGWQADGRAWALGFVIQQTRAVPTGPPDQETWGFDQVPARNPTNDLVVSRNLRLRPVPELDHTDWRSLEYPRGGIRADGSLWAQLGHGGKMRPLEDARDRHQWVSAVFPDEWWSRALRDDGTLWDSFGDQEAAVEVWPHAHWVGLAAGPEGLLTLSPDGRLWNWSGNDALTPLLAPSRRPRSVARIQWPQ